MSREKRSLLVDVERGGHEGRTDIGIQENPAVVGLSAQWARRTPIPAGSPRERLRTELEGLWQPMQRGVSLAHSPARLSWKKSNSSAASQTGALQKIPRAEA